MEETSVRIMPLPNPTPLDDIPKIARELDATFLTNKTRDLAWRRVQLNRLYDLVQDNYSLLCEAMHKDLRKDLFTCGGDLDLTLSETAHCLTHLEEWAAPVPAKKTLFTLFDNNATIHDPLGVVLIIAPWNYPVMLLLAPMAAALAAGNCVVLKPSEVSTHTEALLLDLIPKTFDADTVRIVAGGVPVASALLAQKWDHIFYTGNETVGKIVMTAAAKHLTPVTLELGGKCPVYIHEDANIDVAAQRLAWGKLYNAGQTCIGPDYVLAHKSVLPRLIPALKKAVQNLYGENPHTSPDYGRVVSAGHMKRLTDIIDRQSALPHSQIVSGGEYDHDSKYIAPYFVAGVQTTDPLMESELFGPLMGIVAVSSVDEALSIINSRAHPLCLYVVAESKAVVKKIQNSTRSGTISINDYLANMILSDLPFGGVGSSGFGSYHGRRGFLTFSHERARVWRSADAFSELCHKVAYPPLANTPWALWLGNTMLHYKRPSAAYVFVRNYVPVKALVVVIGFALFFEIGRRVGRGGNFWA
ncbi:hypothetical protein HDU79_008122 [Rhizoclosmatium sp. JEL0117]|nr:hypothetical protein HDU79_008122 [Rhizoclosmatium sp. JEL0117]